MKIIQEICQCGVSNKKSLAHRQGFQSLGWKMGLEPTTPGTTIQCSNRLSYIHHLSPRFSRTVCKGKNYFSFHQNFMIIFFDKEASNNRRGLSMRYFTCNTIHFSSGIIVFTALLYASIFFIEKPSLAIASRTSAAVAIDCCS